MTSLQVLAATLAPPTLHLRTVEGQEEEQVSEPTTIETATNVNALVPFDLHATEADSLKYPPPKKHSF